MMKTRTKKKTKKQAPALALPLATIHRQLFDATADLDFCEDAAADCGLDELAEEIWKVKNRLDDLRIALSKLAFPPG